MSASIAGGGRYASGMRLAVGSSLCVLVIGCTDRANSSESSGTGSATSVVDGEGSATTPTPAECPEPGPATAEFWVDPVPDPGEHGCSIDALRLATDDLDVEIDLGCGVVDPNAGDTGPTVIPTTVKLAPSTVRPEVMIDADVMFVAAEEAAFCGETSSSFAMSTNTGELIAAGVMPTVFDTTIPTGAAGDLTLMLSYDDGCPHLHATLGATTVGLGEGSSTMIAEGDTRLQIDVGRWGESPGESDDCGGNPVLFDAIVLRLP